MGLDMYLAAEKYMSGYSHRGEEDRARFDGILQAIGFPREHAADEAPFLEVKVTVAYWRKANAIHAWFVENVQGGVDECQTSYVSREQLNALRAACQLVLDTAQIAAGMPNHASTIYRPGEEPEHQVEIARGILNGEEIAEILPTQSGFFFGSTDYGEWYLRDVEDTIKQLDRALKLPDEWTFYYHASW